MNNQDIIKEIGLAKRNSKTKIENINGKVYPRYKHCEECHGTLYKEDGSMCECMKDYILRIKLKSINIGEKYYDVNLNFYKQNMKGMTAQIGNKGRNKSVTFFMNYLKLYIDTFDNRLQDGRGFLISGQTGCGKTGALCFVLKQLALKNYNVYYIDTNELLEILSVSYSNDLDSKNKATQTLDKLKQVDLLVLDDFGSEYAKSLDWLYNIFLKLIKTRYSKNLPTLMSTNLPINELMDKFSEDVAPRLSSVFNESFEMITLCGTKDMREVIGKSKSLYEDMNNEIK